MPDIRKLTASQRRSSSAARTRKALSVQNVPLTRRQGVEAGADYRTEKYLVYANYAFIDATYQFSGELASPNNPFADANGNIFVTQIPGIPRHQVKGGIDYWFTPELKLGTASGSVANGLLATTPTRTRSSPTTGSRTCTARTS